MKSPPLDKPLILSIDDDEDLLSLTRFTMQRLGYDVESSLNAEKLWGILAAHLPDIILLDIQMNGITGDEICSSLKKSAMTKNIPVILLSANDNIGIVADKCGADAFVKKPFSGIQMHECIVKLLQHKNIID